MSVWEQKITMQYDYARYFAGANNNPNNNNTEQQISSVTTPSTNRLNSQRNNNIRIGDTIYGRIKNYFKAPGVVVEIQGVGKAAKYTIRWNEDGQVNECRRNKIWTIDEFSRQISDETNSIVSPATLNQLTQLQQQQQQRTLQQIHQQQQQQQQLHRPPVAASGIVRPADRIQQAAYPHAVAPFGYTLQQQYAGNNPNMQPSQIESTSSHTNLYQPSYSFGQGSHMISNPNQNMSVSNSSMNLNAAVWDGPDPTRFTSILPIATSATTNDVVSHEELITSEESHRQNLHRIESQTQYYEDKDVQNLVSSPNSSTHPTQDALAESDDVSKELMKFYHFASASIASAATTNQDPTTDHQPAYAPDLSQTAATAPLAHAPAATILNTDNTTMQQKIIPSLSLAMPQPPTNLSSDSMSPLFSDQQQYRQHPGYTSHLVPNSTAPPSSMPTSLHTPREISTSSLRSVSAISANSGIVGNSSIGLPVHSAHVSYPQRSTSVASTSSTALGGKLHETSVHSASSSSSISAMSFPSSYANALLARGESTSSTVAGEQPSLQYPLTSTHSTSNIINSEVNGHVGSNGNSNSKNGTWEGVYNFGQGVSASSSAAGYAVGATIPGNSSATMYPPFNPTAATASMYNSVGLPIVTTSSTTSTTNDMYRIQSQSQTQVQAQVEQSTGNEASSTVNMLSSSNGNVTNASTNTNVSATVPVYGTLGSTSSFSMPSTRKGATTATSAGITALAGVTGATVSSRRHAQGSDEIAPYHILLPINKLTVEQRGKRSNKRKLDEIVDMDECEVDATAKAKPCRYVCKICHTFKASHYCARCSHFHTDEKHILAICEPATGRDCLIEHLRKCNVPEGCN